MQYHWLKSPTIYELKKIRVLLKQLTQKELSLSLSSLAQTTGRQDTGIILAYTPGNALAGIATIVIVQTLTERFAHVGDVVVNERFRGKQIAEALMGQLHDFARMEGAEFIQLTSKPHRTAALTLYEKLGYTQPDTVYLRFPIAKP